MPDDPRSFPEVDRLIHEPARLAILTVLSACDSADFLFLQNATRLSKGNLSVQISRLQEGRMLYVEKSIRRKKMRTTISITGAGRKAISEYWRTMDEIKKQARPKA
jgi:DNA-binding transcriptional ArsR family regulator